MNMHFVTASASAVLLSSVAVASAADVTMPDPNYATGTAVMHVVKAAIEQELGLEVSTVPASAATVIWQAMDRNKGEVDVWPDAWVPNQQGLVDTYVKQKGSVKLAQQGYEGKQGYCVTQTTYDQYNIRNVSDLANPDNAKLFDRNGDGKGDLWIGAPGWQTTNMEKVRARDYGFSDYFNLESTDEAISNATLDRAAKENKPWVGYCYSPHQNFSRYHLVFLEEPKFDPAKFVTIQPNEDPQWFQKSHIASGYADTSVHIAYAASLAQRQPDLTAALERMSFKPEDVSAWAYQIVIEKKPPDQVASNWIKAHSDVVAKWFGH